MRYADWDYYTTVYRGAEIATEAEFDRLSQRATDYINAVTAGEASLAPAGPAVKNATCAVAEAWQANEQGGGLLSQSVGAWSKTYIGSKRTDGARLSEAAGLYIGDMIARARWA